jgi:hypothetical protein
MEREIQKAKDLREEMIRNLGGENPDDLVFYMILNQLSGMSNRLSGVSGRLSWLMGAMAVGIALLIAIAICVFSL